MIWLWWFYAIYCAFIISKWHLESFTTIAVDIPIMVDIPIQTMMAAKLSKRRIEIINT